MGTETMALLNRLRANALPITVHLDKIQNDPARAHYTTKWWKDINALAKTIARDLERLERRHGDGARERGLQVVWQELESHPDQVARDKAWEIVKAARPGKRGERDE